MTTSQRLYQSHRIAWPHKLRWQTSLTTTGSVTEYYLESYCGRFRLEWKSGLSDSCTAFYRNGDRWVEFKKSTFEKSKRACSHLVVAAACLSRDAERHLRLVLQ